METLLMTPREKDIAGRWTGEAIDRLPPFSFRYDGKASNGFLADWRTSGKSVAGDDGTTVHTVEYEDGDTGLICTLEMTEYPSAPAVEWVVRFRNSGGSDTPIIEDVQALDVVRHCPRDVLPRLHYSLGTHGGIDDFALQSQDIRRGRDVRLASTGGSSVQYLPFFNVEIADGGLVVALGWTGNWACTLARADSGELAVRGGMAKTHLRLRPGETIRTPRVLLLFWQGDLVRAHNMLRRHLVAHHLPRPGGREVQPPICNATWGGMKTHNHLKTIRFIKDNGLDFDCYWIDAGWYGPDHQTEEFQNFQTEDWAYHIGHWRVNRMVHPEGLRPIAEAAHAAGMKLLLWFSPYTAEASSPLVKEHPEWVSRPWVWGKNGIGLNRRQVNLCGINMAVAEARRFLTDYICDLIAEHGVDYFRDDGGTPIGRSEQDPPDRQGMTEIRSVENFYAFWDELRRRHPGMLIDNCGGGGTRIDLETIGRSLVLHRTDYNCHPDADPIGCQVGAYCLAHWVPLVGGAAPARPGDTYNFRSSWSGGIPFSLFHACGFGDAPTAPADDYPVEWHRRMIAQYRRARDYYKGDFYPLTSCSASSRDWLAYQMDRPDMGGGIVLAFRRKDSPFVSAVFRLGGLDPRGVYDLEDADSARKWTAEGSQLTQTGLDVAMERAPDSRLVFYSRRG